MKDSVLSGRKPMRRLVRSRKVERLGKEESDTFLSSPQCTEMGLSSNYKLTISNLSNGRNGGSSAASNVQPADAAQLPLSFLNYTQNISHEQTGIALGGGVENRRHAEPIPTRLHTSGSGVGQEGTGKNRGQCSTANVAILTVSRASVLPSQTLACPQSVTLPSVSDYPKISGGDLYARLLDEVHVKWFEPKYL